MDFHSNQYHYGAQHSSREEYRPRQQRPEAIDWRPRGNIQQMLCPSCGVNVCSHCCQDCYPDGMMLMLCGQCAARHMHPMHPLSLLHQPRTERNDSDSQGGMNEDGVKRASFHVLEMECPHAKVASVIGTRGVVVKEINRRTGCFISINQAFADGHPRIITLKGIYENVIKAQQMILSVIENGPTALDPQKSFSVSSPGVSDRSAVKATGISVSVPCLLEKVGIVIGTRGAVIKEIIRRCNAHIFVAEETVIVGGDVCRMIQISGDEEEVDMGKHLVSLVLQHGPAALDWKGPSSDGGSVPLGRSMPGLRLSGSSIHAAEFMPMTDRSHSPRGSVGSGSSTPRSAVVGGGSPLVETTAEVECPHDSVDVLMGFRGGAVIKEIMQRSSTVITILEGGSGEHYRIFEIRGPRANVAHAKILVQAVIEIGPTALNEDVSALTRHINKKSTKPSVVKKIVDTQKIEFPEEKIGLMIGSKGSMVKQIMSISGTKILISDTRSESSDASRVIEIKGSADEIAVAKALIDSLIHMEPHFQTFGLKTSSSSFGGNPDLDASDQCMEMNLPADKVGVLIGSKGCVIKEIMRHSGARVSINADYTDENVRIVLIRGNRDAIVKAHSIMMDVLKNGYSRLFPSDAITTNASSATASIDGSFDDQGQRMSWPAGLQNCTTFDFNYDTAKARPKSFPTTFFEKNAISSSESLDSISVLSSSLLGGTSFTRTPDSGYSNISPPPAFGFHSLGDGSDLPGSSLSMTRADDIAKWGCILESGGSNSLWGPIHNNLSAHSSGIFDGTDAVSNAVSDLKLTDRHNDAFPHSQIKPTPSGDIICVIPCPIDKVGQIIGPKGAVIKEIGRQSGATVSVRNEVSGDGDVVGQVVVKAQTEKSAEIAKKLILLILDSGSPEPDDVYAPAAHPNRKATISHRARLDGSPF